jgi:hypothetical protein
MFLVVSGFWRQLQHASVNIPVALMCVVVSHADCGCFGDAFAANTCKGYSVFKLSEQKFNGCRWLSHLSHPTFVFVEFVVLDCAKGGP